MTSSRRKDADSGNDYEVTVKATDADGNAAMASITVSVTDVAETATLAVTGLADTTVAENVGVHLVDAGDYRHADRRGDVEQGRDGRGGL